MYNDGFVFKFCFRAACCVIAHLLLTVLFLTNFQPNDASAIVVLSLHAMKTRCAIMHVSHFFMDKGFTASVHLNPASKPPSGRYDNSKLPACKVPVHQRQADEALACKGIRPWLRGVQPVSQYAQQ